MFSHALLFVAFLGIISKYTYGAKCGIPNGGLLVQYISTGSHYPGGLYWCNTSKSLTWVAENDGQVYRWFQSNGTVIMVYIEPLANEKFAALIPISGVQNAYVLFSDNHAHRVDITFDNPNNVTYKVKSKLFQIDKPGYGITSVHTDNSGCIFFVARYIFIDTSKKDILYKKEKDKNITIVTEEYGLGDFTWSKDGKSMYIIGDKGKTVYKYKYNTKKATIKNKNQEVTMDCEEIVRRFTSIETDSSGELQLGLDAEVRTIMKNDKTFDTSIPASCITSLTFGGKHMFVSTCSSKSFGGHRKAAIYAITGYNATGFGDYAITSI